MTLLVNKEKSILIIELARPEVHNAFNKQMIKDLRACVQEYKNDDSLHVIHLRGQGKSFCAGADVNWMKESAKYCSEQNFLDAKEMSDLFFELYSCDIPILGEVHGVALGGGVGLLSVCDVVVANEKTMFGLSEVRLGIIPSVVGPYVYIKMGTRASYSFLNGQRFNALKAMELGLVHETFSDLNRQEVVTKQVNAFLSSGPKAIREAKKLLRSLSTPSNFEDQRVKSCKTIARLRVTNEAQEGMSALLEKRSPSW